MTEKRKRPPSGSDDVRDRQANERLVGWIGRLVAFLTVTAVLLALLMWMGTRG